MTITGKVFQSYAQAVIAKHGHGSRKMVKQHDTEYIHHLQFVASRLEREGKREEASEVYKSFLDAEKWLIENGWLREYGWSVYSKSYHESASRIGTSIGLTEKGWAVAEKYLNAKD